MTRSLFSALALSFLPFGLQAQSMQELMQAAMEEAGKNGGAQVSITENTDPFVPLDFTGTFNMEMHSFKNGKAEKDSPATIRMSMTSDRMAMIPTTAKGKEEVRIFFDLKNKHSYTLMTDDKGNRSGFKTKMMKFSGGTDGSDTKSDSDAKMVRTGETKMIEGHTCTKYTYTSAEGNGTAWIAEDIKFDIMQTFAQMSGSAPNKDWQKVPYSGLMMENNWNSADGKERVDMYIRDLQVGKVDEAMFSTAGYNLQDMTNMPSFGR